MTRPFTNLASYYLLVPGFAGLSTAVTLRTLRCNNAGAADRYLQAFSGTAIPSDTSVPLFAPLLLPNGYISEDNFIDGRQIAAPGLVLVVSSTRATLTKDAAATVDITAEVDEYELPAPSGDSVAGDYTTAVKKLQVWAEASGPKTLIKIEAANTSVATVYLQMFAKEPAINGETPENEWSLAAGEYKVISFGNYAGTYPRRRIAASAPVHEGCELTFSSTSGSRTIVAANAGYLRATYR